MQRLFANKPYFFLADCVQNGKTDKEDGDDFSKRERLEKLASFQLLMIKHAMMCKCHGPPSFSSLSISKMPSRVNPVFFYMCNVFALRGTVLRISDAAGRSDVPTRSFSL